MFHTHANGLTAAMDVAPILVFIRFTSLPITGFPWTWPLVGRGAVVAFVPYAALTRCRSCPGDAVPGVLAGYAPIR